MELGEPDDERPARAGVRAWTRSSSIDCDTVIMAVGTRANPLLKDAAPDLELTSRGYIVTDEDGYDEPARCLRRAATS